MAAEAVASVGGVDLARFARANEAVWPAARVEAVEGWRVLIDDPRASRRATSARWAGPSDPASGIEAVAATYRDAGLRPRFQHFDGDGAEAAVDAAGYPVEEPCTVLARETAIDWPEPARGTSVIEVRARVALVGEILARGGMTAPRRAVFDRAPGVRAVFLGRVGQSPAGAVGVTLDGEVAVTQSLWVEPAARRSGLGGALMAAIGRFAREHGARVVAHGVNDANEGALAFYARHGFLRLGGYRYRSGA